VLLDFDDQAMRSIPLDDEGIENCRQLARGKRYVNHRAVDRHNLASRELFIAGTVGLQLSTGVWVRH
jgi:hypothetical protein